MSLLVESVLSMLVSLSYVRIERCLNKDGVSWVNECHDRL